MGHLAGNRRLNTCTLFIGRKGSGKSTKACKVAQDYVRVNRAKGKRALIVDVNGAPAYDAIKFIPLEKIVTWRPTAQLRIAKTYLGEKDEDDEEVLFNGLKKFRDGFLHFEDCTKYIDPSPKKYVKKFLVDHRMWNLDLGFTFHSLVRVPPMFWEMTTHVMLCKTQDARRYLENNQRIPNLEAMLKAYDSVMADPDPFACRLVKTLI